MIPDNYPRPRSLTADTVELTCRNCGRKRRAVWVVARLLPKDAEGQPYTEVCHECLNQEGLGKGLVRIRT